MSGHLNQEEMILSYYGEASRGAHFEECQQCRAEYSRLAEVLDSVCTVPVPARPDNYGAEVWRRIEPLLDREPSRPVDIRAGWRRLAVPAAIAAMLVIAFQLGRYMPANQPTAEVATMEQEGSERVLDTALGAHLERSRMMLVDLVNSPDQARTNIAPERLVAEDLLESNRLYRQSAAQVGARGLEDTLDDLERILLEISHSPETVPADTIESLRKRIESLELLFRVRILESKIRGRRESAALPESSL